MITHPLLAAVAALPALAALACQLGKVDGARAIRLTSGTMVLAFAALAGGAAAGAAGLIMLDPVATAVSLLTLFVGAIVLGFSVRYMRADPRPGLFAARISWLVASVLVFLGAGDVVSFAAAWIASGALLATLIGHVRGWEEAKAATQRARRAFLVGDFALVAAFVLLATSTGSVQISAILAAAPDLSFAVGGTAILLILVAALSRSAVPPFHKWLMGSMTAPTPVSALMHAGLVNAGGFVLIRFAPLLEAWPAAKTVAVVAGAVGALWGTGVMLVRPDIKRALGGSTVAQMSFMVMTCGLGAYAAALWHLIAHGLFKAWLFLGSGSSISERRATPERIGAPALIMTVGLGLAVLIAALGVPGALALPIPLTLALVSAAYALAGALRAGAAGLRTAVLLILTYAGGVALMAQLPGVPTGSNPLGIEGQIALLGAFLIAWAWQASGMPLPARLYIRMLNTGGPALIR